jgi:hypothetical protein
LALVVAIVFAVRLIARQVTALDAKKPFDIRTFPFASIQVEGTQALQEWQRLKSAGRGIPLIVGSIDNLQTIARHWHENRKRPNVQTVIKGPAGSPIRLSAPTIAALGHGRRIRHPKLVWR